MESTHKTGNIQTTGRSRPGTRRQRTKNSSPPSKLGFASTVALGVGAGASTPWIPPVVIQPQGDTAPLPDKSNFLNGACAVVRTSNDNTFPPYFFGVGFKERDSKMCYFPIGSSLSKDDDGSGWHKALNPNNPNMNIARCDADSSTHVSYHSLDGSFTFYGADKNVSFRPELLPEITPLSGEDNMFSCYISPTVHPLDFTNTAPDYLANCTIKEDKYPLFWKPPLDQTSGMATSLGDTPYHLPGITPLSAGTGFITQARKAHVAITGSDSLACAIVKPGNNFRTAESTFVFLTEEGLQQGSARFTLPSKDTPSKQVFSVGPIISTHLTPNNIESIGITADNSLELNFNDNTTFTSNSLTPGTLYLLCGLPLNADSTDGTLRFIEDNGILPLVSSPFIWGDHPESTPPPSTSSTPPPRPSTAPSSTPSSTGSSTPRTSPTTTVMSSATSSEDDSTISSKSNGSEACSFQNPNREDDSNKITILTALLASSLFLNAYLLWHRYFGKRSSAQPRPNQVAPDPNDRAIVPVGFRRPNPLFDPVAAMRPAIPNELPSYEEINLP